MFRCLEFQIRGRFSSVFLPLSVEGNVSGTGGWTTALPGFFPDVKKYKFGVDVRYFCLGRTSLGSAFAKAQGLPWAPAPPAPKRNGEELSTAEEGTQQLLDVWVPSGMEQARFAAWHSELALRPGEGTVKTLSLPELTKAELSPLLQLLPSSSSSRLFLVLLCRLSKFQVLNFLDISQGQGNEEVFSMRS